MKPLFTLILSLSLASTTGCGLMSSQSNKSEKVTQSDPFMQSLHSIDSALTTYRSEHEKAIYEKSNYILNSLEPKVDSTRDMQLCFDSAKNQWSQFVKLCKKGKRKEALELYQTHTEDFLLYLTPSHIAFQFDTEILYLLLQEYVPIEEANKQFQEALEFNLLSVESVILWNSGQYVPPHYGTLYTLLSQIYLDTENYRAALELTDKLLAFLGRQGEQESYDYACGLYNKGIIAIRMNDDKRAKSVLTESIQLYEKLGLKGSTEWQNCINELESINQ